MGGLQARCSLGNMLCMSIKPAVSPAQIVVTAFGGVRAAARVLCVDPSCVSRWQSSGLVPTSRQRRILELAWKMGIDITANDLVFGRNA